MSKDERIVCNEIYKYKGLRYKYFKDNTFFLVRMKLSLFNSYVPFGKCIFFERDRTYDEHYINVLIPIIEGNSESKLRY